MNLFSQVPLAIEVDKKLVTDPKDIIKHMTYLGVSQQQSLIILLIEQLIVNGLYEKLLDILKIGDWNPQNQKIYDEIQINKQMTLRRFQQLQSMDQKQKGLYNIYKHIMDQKFSQQEQIGASQINKYLMQEFGVNIQILDDQAIKMQLHIKLNGINDAILYLTDNKFFSIRLPQQQLEQSSKLQQQISQQQSSSSKLQSQTQSQQSSKMQQQQQQSSQFIIQQKNNCVQCYQQGKQFYFDEQQYLKFQNLLKQQSGIEQFECQYCNSKFNKNDIQDYVKIYERYKSQQQSNINAKNQSNLQLMCRNCEVIQENQSSIINNVCTKCFKTQQNKGLNTQLSSQMLKSKANYYEQKEKEQDVVCNLCQKYCNPNDVFKLSCGHIYCFQCGEQITKQPFFKCRQSTCSSKFEQNTLIKFLDKHKQANKMQAQRQQVNNSNIFNQVESNIQEQNQISMIQSKQSKTLSQQSLQLQIQPNYMPSTITQSKKDSKIYSNSKNCQMCGEDFSKNNIQVQMQCFYNHVIGICCFISEYQDCLICEIKNPYQIYRFEYQPFQKQKLYYLSNPNEGRQPNRYQQVQDDQKVIPYRENIAVIRTPQQIRTTSQPNYRQ